MNVSVETMNNLERRLTISVPSETFEGQITERLNKSASQVKLPGFRPGKVPMREVRRRFGKAVRAEVAGELMQSSFVEAITNESLSPAGSPNLEVVKMDPGIDFEFTASFEVFPSVALGNLAEVEVLKPIAEISDTDLDEMVEKLREQRKTFNPVERAAQKDDQVKVDFVGRMDGEEFDGGKGEGMTFVIGAGQMIEDFDKGVAGQSTGAEVTFDATFPEDYQAENLAGNTVQFEVKVVEVAEATLPELGPELYKEFQVESGEESDFRDQVRSNMQRELDTAVRNQLRSQVMDELARLHEFPIPGSTVTSEIQGMKQQMMQQMQMPAGAGAGMDLPDELFSEQAERRVKVGLIVNEIVQTNKLEADTEAVREHIDTMAAGYADAEQVVNWYYSNPEQLQRVEMAVLEEKVIDTILNQAVVNDLSSSYADIIANKALPSDESDDSSAELTSESGDKDE